MPELGVRSIAFGQSALSANARHQSLVRRKRQRACKCGAGLSLAGRDQDFRVGRLDARGAVGEIEGDPESAGPKATLIGEGLIVGDARRIVAGVQRRLGPP